MMNHYRKLMDRQTLSDTATTQFQEKLDAATPAKASRTLRITLVAACLCLLIPLAVIAATGSFGKPKSEPMTNISRAGKGYVTSVDDVYPRSISDFSPELQTLDGSEIIDFSSFQEAEDHIGFTLLDAPALFSGDIEKRNVVLTADGKSHIYHCLTSFTGDGQLFMGHVEAYFRKDWININLRAKITADHPDMTDEVMESIHKTAKFFIGSPSRVQITSENITTQAGLPVCITSAKQSHSTDYEATFAINGVSFSLVISGHGNSRNAEAKELLLQILESIQV